MVTELKKELDSLIPEGLVSVKEQNGLFLYDYSMFCQIKKAWRPCLLQARGLVLNANGDYVARPFNKFFNLGEMPHTKMSALPKQAPEVSEKIDGSMIVLFFDFADARWRCCTRGSWVSDQAKWAWEYLKRNNIPPRLKKGPTYVFEYVAPWNRVVIPYAEESMVLLGVVHEDGRESGYLETAIMAGDFELPYPTYHMQDVESLESATLISGTGCKVEGYVLHWPNIGYSVCDGHAATGLRVKLKYTDYKDLHRIITGYSAKSIWHMLADGYTSDLPPQNLPDEFFAWYTKVRNHLVGQYDEAAKQVEEVFAQTNRQVSRKDIALSWAYLPGHVKAALFRKLDSKSYKEVLWKALEPEGKEQWFGKNEVPEPA